MSRRSHQPGVGSQSFMLENFLPYRLSVLTNTVSRTLARRYAEPFGVGVLEWRVMAVVGRFAPMSANQVCARTAMDKVAVSRATRALVDKGLLRRQADPRDLRRARLSLSSRGQGIHDDIVVLAEELEAELLVSLSLREQRQLDRLLSKLTGRARDLDTGHRSVV